MALEEQRRLPRTRDSDEGCRAVAARGWIVPVEPTTLAALTNVFAFFRPRALGAHPGRELSGERPRSPILTTTARNAS